MISRKHETSQTCAAVLMSAGFLMALSAPAAADQADVVGTLTIDGQSHDLTTSYWCEPEPSVQEGETVAIWVWAFDDSQDVSVLGTQIDRDRDRPSVQRVTATLDGSSTYRTGDVTPKTQPEPAIVVEDGRVTMQADVISGGEIVDLAAEFMLPEAPGAPGYC